jgi:predicted ArsR family transcriptional regulator
MMTTEALVSAAGMRVIKLLVGNPAETVADLIKATGVTRTAITEQLNELVAAGFVERSTERLTGRGRPRHLYAATNSALLLLFASNQQLVVPAMWRAIQDVGGTKLTEQVLNHVSRSLAEHYRRRITAKDPERRLKQMTELLREEGVLVELEEENGQVLLRKRSCPFFSMLDEARHVCCVDLAMLTAVVGRPVHRTACRHDGAPCCEFGLNDGGRK